MNDHRTFLGWPFLVARGRHVGYRSILVPAFLVGTEDDGILSASIQGHVDPAGPARIDLIPTTTVGVLAAVYATYRVTRADIARHGAGQRTTEDHGLGRPYNRKRPENSGELVTDRHSRPLELLYGFVCRGDTIGEIDEADLHAARRTALDVYGQFLDDEKGFAVEPSTAFPLRSRIRPIRLHHEPPAGTAPPVAPPSPAPLSTRRSPSEPAASSRGARTWNAIIGVLAITLLAVAGKVLLTRSSSSAPAGSDIQLSGDPQCTLDETRSNSCVIRLTVSVPDTFDLRSLATNIDASPGIAAGHDAWDVDDSDCQRPPEATDCQLQITANPSTDPITEDLEAVLHLTFEDPSAARDVSLRAAAPH